MIFEAVYLSPEQLNAWRNNPNGITPEEHANACNAGFIELEEGLVAKCPICQTNAEHRKFLEQLNLSGIGERYHHVEWDDLELLEPLPRLKRAGDRVLEIRERGENALVWGPPGTGKTQAAVLILKAALRARLTARIDNLGRLAMDIRAGYDGAGPTEAAAVKILSEADILVLDDIGAGETGSAKLEQRVLYLVTEARQNQGLPTVLTTNLTPEKLGQAIGSRILNRLQPLAVIGFKHGRNFRKPEGEQESVW